VSLSATPARAPRPCPRSAGPARRS
jgi:hypothetical protein